jgi:ankyrin repeat protein
MQTHKDFEKYKSENKNKFDKFYDYDSDLCKNEKWLIFSAKNGHLPVSIYLVSVGCDPMANNNWAIQLVAANNHLHVVIYLVSIGCDPKADHNLAIRWAAAHGHLHVVKYLVSVGCDPKTGNNYAIRGAARRGHLHVVKYLDRLDSTSKTRTSSSVTSVLLTIMSDKFGIFKGVIRDLIDKV